MVEVVAALIWEKDRFMICQQYEFCPTDKEILEMIMKEADA